VAVESAVKASNPPETGEEEIRFMLLLFPTGFIKRLDVGNKSLLHIRRQVVREFYEYMCCYSELFLKPALSACRIQGGY